jgi:hypothetical protein
VSVGTATVKCSVPTERGGWQWQYTRMEDPARAERLWLALALATEGVDDLSHSLAAIGVAHVMGELVVDDLGSVAILAPRGPKVHAH